MHYFNIDKQELINTIVESHERLDQLWEFHPDNPEGKDVAREYELVLLEIRENEENLKDFE